MTTTTTTTTTAAADENQPEATVAEGRTVADEIAQLVAGLQQRGVAVNLNNVDLDNLRAHVNAAAALQLLVTKGVCTEEEALAAVQSVVKHILAGLLQAVEEAALNAAKSIQTVQKPPIQIARLRD